MRGRIVDAVMKTCARVSMDDGGGCCGGVSGGVATDITKQHDAMSVVRNN